MLRYNFNNATGLCARQFGTTYGLQRYFYSRTELRNMYAGDGLENNKAGIPNGHTEPSSWVIPQSTGSISAYEETRTVMSLSLAVGSPLAGNGNTTFAVTTSGTLAGIGNIIGAVTPFTELSPKNLADAVWTAESNQYTTAGTMGKNANDVKTNSGLIPALV
jgi:hypothetical protein